MTAREKTRKAIADTLRSRRGAPEGSLPPRIDHLANAASDVWEPILRDLLDALDTNNPFDPAIGEAVARAQEALDGTPQ